MKFKINANQYSMENLIEELDETRQFLWKTYQP